MVCMIMFIKIIVLLYCSTVCLCAPQAALWVDECDVLVNGNQAKHVPAWNRQVLYHQVVDAPSLYDVPVTFVIRKGSDAAKYYLKENNVTKSGPLDCVNNQPCELNYTYGLPFFNGQDSVNEMHTDRLAVKHGGRQVCVLNLQLREAKIDVVFGLIWTDKNSLRVSVTAGFPEPNEYSLKCNGVQMNFTFSGNEFKVNGEELRLKHCQVTAKTYLSTNTTVDVPVSPYTTTPTTTTTTLAATDSPMNNTSSDTQIMTLYIVVAILVVFSIVLVALLVICFCKKETTIHVVQPEDPPPENATCDPTHAPSMSDESVATDISSSGYGDEIDGPARTMSTDDSDRSSLAENRHQMPIAETGDDSDGPEESSPPARVTAPSDGEKVGVLNERR